jgi:hypothetical protein
VREDSAIGNLESRPGRADLGLAAQDRISRIREGLAARVCKQNEIGVNLDPKISRDLCWIERLAEGKVN